MSDAAFAPNSDFDWTLSDPQLPRWFRVAARASYAGTFVAGYEASDRLPSLTWCVAMINVAHLRAVSDPEPQQPWLLFRAVRADEGASALKAASPSPDDPALLRRALRLLADAARLCDASMQGRLDDAVALALGIQVEYLALMVSSRDDDPWSVRGDPVFDAARRGFKSLARTVEASEAAAHARSEDAEATVDRVLAAANRHLRAGEGRRGLAGKIAGNLGLTPRYVNKLLRKHEDRLA